MKKIIVLGANSFSGQDFVDLLLDQPDYQVIGVSRSAERSALFLRYKLRPDLTRYRYVQADVNHAMPELLALFDQERPNYIVNFAAQSEVAPSWEHPEHWYQTNTVALAQMLKHLVRQTYLERYLHISSPEVYGTCVGTVTEASPKNPSTPYAASKAAADDLLAVYHKQYQFPLLTVRATNVYGARQQLFKLIPRSAIYMRLGKRIELHGGGVAVKSFMHIRDVSRGELAILEQGTLGRLYHLSPDNSLAVHAVVRLICERMGQAFDEATEIVAERPGQDAAYVIDSTLARTTLNWQPQLPMATGINEVVEWVEAYWDEIRNQPLIYEHKA